MHMQAIKSCVDSIFGGFRLIAQRFNKEYTDFFDKMRKIHPQGDFKFERKDDLNRSNRAKDSQHCINKT